MIRAWLVLGAVLAGGLAVGYLAWLQYLRRIDAVARSLEEMR